MMIPATRMNAPKNVNPRYCEYPSGIAIVTASAHIIPIKIATAIKTFPFQLLLLISSPSRTEIRYTCTICDNVHLMAEINQISAITINTSIYTAIASYICSPPCVFETTDFADSCSNSARWYISLIFIITMIIHVLVYRH